MASQAQHDFLTSLQTLRTKLNDIPNGAEKTAAIAQLETVLLRLHAFNPGLDLRGV